jgi:glycerol-3-phosphate O-acyltransferase
MTQAITLPLWIFIALLALALLAALEWLLLPGLRWYFRRKVRGVMDEISVRLKIDIPPFKLTRRQALIDRLMSDPRVLSTVQDYAAQQKISHDAAMQMVNRYAREIVPAFNAYVYFPSATGCPRNLRTCSTGSGWATPMHRPWPALIRSPRWCLS